MAVNTDEKADLEIGQTKHLDGEKKTKYVNEPEIYQMENDLSMHKV